MGSHQKKWPASGAWLGAAPVLTVRDSGGAERGDSAAGDGSSVRRRAGLFAEQRGREKGRGKWGSRPGRAEEGGGPTCARSGGLASSGAPPAEVDGGRAPWSEQGRKWAPKSGPCGYSARRR
jgi:hypothetical protein